MKSYLLILATIIFCFSCSKNDDTNSSINMPVADFSTNDTIISAGLTATFYNFSVNSITSTWSFPGGTPNTSTEFNPKIAYNSSGIYSVTLTVTNSDGSDRKTKTNYIKVGSGITGTWTKTNIPENTFDIEWMYIYGNSIYIGNTQQTLVTTNMGETWKGINHGSLSYFISDNTAIAVTPFTIDISKDSGTSWTTVFTFPLWKGGNISSVAKIGNTLLAYLTDTNGGSYTVYSTDNGNTWIRSEINDLDSYAAPGIVFDLFSHDGTVILSTLLGIYKSNDGIAWTQSSTRLSTYFTSSAYLNNKIFAVSTGGELFYSSDNGDNWIKNGGALSELLSWNNKLFSIHPGGNLIFMSNDEGLSGINIEDDLKLSFNYPDYLSVSCIGILNGYIFAGIGGGTVSNPARGVYKRDLSNFPLK